MKIISLILLFLLFFGCAISKDKSYTVSTPAGQVVKTPSKCPSVVCGQWTVQNLASNLKLISRGVSRLGMANVLLAKSLINW